MSVTSGLNSHIHLLLNDDGKIKTSRCKTSLLINVIHLSLSVLFLYVEQQISPCIHSFIPLACAECDDSLPLSGASSIPLHYVLASATLLQKLFFHPLSPHLAIYFLVYLSILLFTDLYITPFWEFYFLPFSVHAHTNIIYLHLLFLL